MDLARPFLLFALIATVAGLGLFAVGTLTGARHAEAHQDPAADPYAYYQVTGNDTYLVRYNPQTGASWALACPTNASSCEWDPIEVREPEE